MTWINQERRGRTAVIRSCGAFPRPPALLTVRPMGKPWREGNGEVSPGACLGGTVRAQGGIVGRRNRARRAGAPAEDAIGPEVGALFLPLALQNFLMTYNSSAMNVALSAIIGDLHTTLTGVQSVISLYSLVIAAFLITCSKLGARHGHRRTFVFGAEVFALGTLVTALSPNLAFMLVGWSLLQGIGVALMLPALLALLTGALTGAARTRALAAMGTIGGSARRPAPSWAA